MTAEANFKKKVVPYMEKFMDDFDADVLDASAVFGNAGYESAGFTKLQEIKPVVPGSRGGYGWFQWTGPRRVAFENYCKRNNLDPKSDEANYKFLFTELMGPEKKAIPALKKAVGLEAKVRAFENTFERAGVKNYAARNTWARRALAAWEAKGGKVEVKPEEPPVAKPAEVAGSAGAAVGAGIAAAASGFDWWLIALIAVMIGVSAFIIIKAMRD